MNFSHLGKRYACGVGTGKFLYFDVFKKMFVGFPLETQYMEELGH